MSKYTALMSECLQIEAKHGIIVCFTRAPVKPGSPLRPGSPSKPLAPSDPGDPRSPCAPCSATHHKVQTQTCSS